MRATPVSSLTIAPALKEVAKTYGDSKFGSLTAYVEHLLREDLTRLGFEIGESLEKIAKRAGVKWKKPESGDLP